MEEALKAAYLAGFEYSCEGCNGEYSGGVGPVEKNEYWCKARDNFIKEYIAQQQEPVACDVCNEVHSILDRDESKIIRNARDGYPDGRTPRLLTLQERVMALCSYARDWKRWCIAAEAIKPWVGLTYEDIEEIADMHAAWENDGTVYPHAFAGSVEAKLRAKNGGAA